MGAGVSQRLDLLVCTGRVGLVSNAKRKLGLIGMQPQTHQVTSLGGEIGSSADDKIHCDLDVVNFGAHLVGDRTDV